MFKHTETAQNLVGWYAVEKGAKDSLAPKVSVDDELTLAGKNYQIADVIEALYNQSNNNDATTGGNAFADLLTDHQQLSAVIANIGSNPKNGINITRDAEAINLLAWDMLKQNISHKGKDISDYARAITGYLDYKNLTNSQKLQLVEDMPAILEELGGDSTKIAAAQKRINRTASQAYEVDSATLMKSFQESLINMPRFKDIEDLEDAKEYVAEAYKALSPLDLSVMLNELDKRYKEEQTQSPLTPITVTTKEKKTSSTTSAKTFPYNIEKLEEAIEISDYTGLTEAEIKTVVMNKVQRGELNLSENNKRTGQTQFMKDINTIVKSIVETLALQDSDIQRISKTNPRIKSILDRE